MRPPPAILTAVVALLVTGCGAHQVAGTSPPAGGAGTGQPGAASSIAGSASGSVTSGDGQAPTPTAPTTTPGASVVPEPVPGGTGVHGVLSVGPTCPVQHAGQTCQQPLQARIEAHQGNTVAASTTSDSSGRYAIALAPGSYQLQVVVSGPSPRCPTETVTVQQGQEVTADITCDSGIR